MELFFRTMKGHPDRYAGISALRANVIDVYQSGGHKENRLLIDEYVKWTPKIGQYIKIL